jgi:hypothetical protein
MANDKHLDYIENKDANDILICLFRPNHVPLEESYWNAHSHILQSNNKIIQVMPYDMLDGRATLYEALNQGYQHHHSTNPSPISLCLYHVTSTFRPTPDPIHTARQNSNLHKMLFDALSN